MLPYVVMNIQTHHMIWCSLMYTLTQIWNVHRLKKTSISKLPFHLTLPCVLPFTMHLHASEILHVLLLLHLMSYLLDWPKVVRLSMTKIVSLHRNRPTRHHLVCYMKTTHQVSLLKMKSLMNLVTEMAAILREFLKLATKTILKPCVIWFTSQNAIFQFWKVLGHAR